MQEMSLLELRERLSHLSSFLPIVIVIVIAY